MLKTLTLVGPLLLAVTQGAFPALSQEFPTKQPIKMVVASNAGGGTDVMARVTAEYLGKQLGQAVVVENKPGAASAIGADYVAKSRADGYTLYFTAAELAVIPAVRNDLPYKFDEFTYLTRIATVPVLMFGSPKLPASTIPELVAYMKANPGKVRYGTTGVGAIVHLGIAMFEGATGVKGTHVPYTGIAPVYTDMLGGNIEITEASPAGVPEEIKVLGSVGSKRHPAHPNIPTAEESGIKGATWDIWYGIVAPPNLPKPIADRIIAGVSAVVKDPEAIAKFKAASKVEPDSNIMIGDEFKKQTIEDNKRWKAVAEREKIVVK
jgi:tripartite-type tricarboxylate transporter receptor subunit TctC